MTTGEVHAHLAEVYGVEVSRQTISTISEQVLAGMAEWQSRRSTSSIRWSASTPST